MPTVTLLRPVPLPTATGRGNDPAEHPHVTVVSTAGRVTLGATEARVSYSGIGASWAQIDRPGDTPLLRRAGRNRLTAKVRSMLIGGFGGKTVAEQLEELDRICAAKATCGVSYAEMSDRRWQLTEVTLETIDRAHLSNRIKHADVELTFVAAVDEQLTPPSRKNKPDSDKGRTKPTTYVVRKGDTLARIAAKVYGNANRWPEIARRNDIKDPRSIRPGDRLKV